MKMFLNEEEAAHEAGISPSSIKRAVNSGDLRTVPGMKIDGQPIRKTVIHSEDLIAWLLDEPRTTPTPRSRRSPKR